ncbi:MAG: 16S rRNA (adenine(1518)-N(6)/adenine(1519)-N(6))-dimethyltransferase RsmA [Caldilineaceae bacterium]
MPKSSSPSPHVKAKKSLGQNFLQDRTYLDQIVAAAELTPDDLVLEIGPGQGVLTRELAARAAGVVAVELDDRLIIPLRAMFATQLDRVQIVHGDILELDPVSLVDQLARQLPGREAAPPYKVVANLPYYITSAALRQLLEARRPPSRAVVLVQLEVAQRICAEPGDMSLLAASVQYYARAELVQRVPAGAFRPVPKVDSAILRLDVYPQPAVAVAPDAFFAVVRAGFGQKRKQLLNSLSAGLGRPKPEIAAALACAAVDPMRRAETLALAEWESLCRCLAQNS